MRPEDLLARLEAGYEYDPMYGRLCNERDQLKAENAKLRELVRDYHRFADAICAERDCDGCSQCDEGACERGVLTSRECVLGVEYSDNG